MRYTEVRLARAASLLLDDIDKDTVDFQPNYDETEQEPKVLPAAFPNLLINGGNGIAVGMATNIPPHNPGEIIDATLALIAEPDTSLDDLMRIVPGPDFPTGGIIVGRSGIRAAFETGRGSITIRARARIRGDGARPRSDHHHRDPVPGEQGDAARNVSANWCAPSRSKASAACATRATAPACASSSSCGAMRRPKWC